MDYWVWINPDNWLVNHQISITGGFTSGGLRNTGNSNLMFIPNPDFKSDITPFQFGIMREYLAEYNLELGRETYFADYPSRLNAIYLFDSEEEAYKYKEKQKQHVSGRILKRGHSVGPSVYSKHDSSWVDFLRLTHSTDATTISNVCQAYWNGTKVEDCELASMGNPWSQDVIFEVLFIGGLMFYDRNLER